MGAWTPIPETPYVNFCLGPQVKDSYTTVPELTRELIKTSFNTSPVVTHSTKPTGDLAHYGVPEHMAYGELAVHVLSQAPIRNWLLLVKASASTVMCREKWQRDARRAVTDFVTLKRLFRLKCADACGFASDGIGC